MKLFPALVATLLQEAKSQTCDGNPVFAVTCHEDLVVELAKFWCNNGQYLTLVELDNPGSTAPPRII